MNNIGDLKRGRDIGMKYRNGAYIWVACAGCLKEYWTEFRKGTTKSAYCHSCATRLLPRREKIRASKLGSKNPMWKGDDITDNGGRNRAWKLFKQPEPCKICNRLLNVERHHIDLNPKHNEIENIVWLCRFHHMMADKRLYRRDKAGKFATTPLSE